MPNKPPFNPTKLLWLDLEMTGLDPEEDVILELALEVTDTYESKIRHPKVKVIERIAKNTWWHDYAHNRDEFINNLDAAPPIQMVEREVIERIEYHFGKEPVVLAGNSIHNDRAFIRKALPELELRLHYRMLDVSSFKILMQHRYGAFFKKPEIHRAYDDIQASIAELQYYIDTFMVDPATILRSTPEERRGS
jgi:oligoribonuclease